MSNLFFSTKLTSVNKVKLQEILNISARKIYELKPENLLKKGSGKKVL